MTRDQAVTTVRKLLALGKSSNPHEAAAAIERATAILERYGLSTAELEAPIEEWTEEELWQLEERGRWPALLLCVLAEAEGAVAYRHKEGRKTSYTLFGEPGSVIRVRALYAHLTVALAVLAGKRRGARRDAFLSGVVAALAERLAPPAPSPEETGSSLVLVRLDATIQAFEARFKEAKTEEVEAPEKWAAARRNGIRKGRKIHMGGALNQ